MGWVLFSFHLQRFYSLVVSDECATLYLVRGTVKYYAQIHLQVWQNSVCTGQGNLPLIT